MNAYPIRAVAWCHAAESEALNDACRRAFGMRPFGGALLDHDGVEYRWFGSPLHRDALPAMVQMAAATSLQAVVMLPPGQDGEPITKGDAVDLMNLHAALLPASGRVRFARFTPSAAVLAAHGLTRAEAVDDGSGAAAEEPNVTGGES